MTPLVATLPVVRHEAAVAEHVVGISELRVARGERLITYALGSCLGIAVHDPVAGVGGLLHAMLPLSSLDAAKAQAAPAMFVDSGVPLLFKECYRLGARKERMTVRVAGGSFAAESEAEDRFQIGKRNLLTLRQLLWKNGVMIHAADTGGSRRSRTMTLDAASGIVTIRSDGATTTL